jgi:hemerythrin
VPPPSHLPAPDWASPLIVWRDAWCLGIESLDTDHQELVRLLNALLQVQGAPSPKPGLDPPAEGQRSPEGSQVAGLATLIAHLRAHFQREEALMSAIDYADREAHRGEHAMQIAELMALCREQEERGERRLQADSLEWIKRWCFDHLVSEDRRLAEAYHRRTTPSAGRNH